jgi:hypothetical protein
MRAFNDWNRGKPYPDQIKPANFLLLAHDDPLVALPSGLRRERLTLIAPYSRDPEEWTALAFRNRFDGRRARVTTRIRGSPGAVRLKTYGDVIAEFSRHPEGKSGDGNGERCTRATVGLLTRLHVRAARIRHIGKESNHLEEVESGELKAEEDPVLEYVDVLADWRLAVPALRDLRDQLGPKAISEHAGISRRALRYALNGGRVPRAPARQALIVLARTSKE